jgi:hypothetical protein
VVNLSVIVDWSIEEKSMTPRQRKMAFYGKPEMDD